MSKTITDNVEIPVTQIKSKCLKLKYLNDDESYVMISYPSTNN